MRSVLLSLKPEVFENIVKGEKIFEHRKVFPEGPIEAYIYISRPVQALAGIMILDNKVSLEQWKEKYSYDSAAVARIDSYLGRYNVAMEIQKFQNTTRIPLSTVRNDFPNFLIPQMYYYLDDLPLYDYLKKNLKPVGKPITHKFNEITSDLICIH